MQVIRLFVETSEFTKSWRKLGLTDEDLWDLEDFLVQHPDFGDVIQGTGGLRKMRWAAKGKGKRGGSRVCYVDLVLKEKIYLIAAFSKNQKADLTEPEKREIKDLIKRL